MLRTRTKRPFRRGSVPTVAPPTSGAVAERALTQSPAAPPAPPSPPLSPSPKPSPRSPLSCLNIYESRIQTLERLLKVTETDLLTAEEERDCLLTQLAESQAHAAALQRDVLSLQLLRNELVLQRLDARDAADELALRREVLEEELGRRERVLRKVREENRLLNRENERLRVELGVVDRGKRREVRGRLLSKASREALRKASREALRQLGTVTPASATTEAPESTEAGSESTPREGTSRNSLQLWVQAYGPLVDHPDYRAAAGKESRPETPSTPTTPKTPSSPTPTPTLRATTPRLPTPTLRPARSTFGRAPGSFRLRSGSETPPPVPPVPPLAALLNGAAPIITPPETSGDDLPSHLDDEDVVNLNSPGSETANPVDAPDAPDAAADAADADGSQSDSGSSARSNQSVHHRDLDGVRRPSADRVSVRSAVSDLSTAFFSSTSQPPSEATDSARPSIESVRSMASAGSSGSGSGSTGSGSGESGTAELVVRRPVELTLATAELSLPRTAVREVRRQEEQQLDWPAWTAPRVLRPPPRPRRTRARRETLTPVTEASSPETATPSVMPAQLVPELEQEVVAGSGSSGSTVEKEKREEVEPVQKLDWPAWSATSLTSTNSAHWDSSSSHFADVESANDHDTPPAEGETEVDFSLIDPSHIALIEVSSDAGH